MFAKSIFIFKCVNLDMHILVRVRAAKHNAKIKRIQRVLNVNVSEATRDPIFKSP